MGEGDTKSRTIREQTLCCHFNDLHKTSKALPWQHWSMTEQLHHTSTIIVHGMLDQCPVDTDTFPHTPQWVYPATSTG